MALTSVSKRLYLGLVYTFLYLPIGAIILLSFNNSAFSLAWHGATLHWYRVLFHDNATLTVAWHSLVLALCASIAACACALLTAFCLFRFRFLGRRLIYTLLLASILMPDLLTGITMLVLFHWVRIPLGFISLWIAHISFCYPFATVIIFGRLLTLDKHMLEAAKDLGASEWMIFKTVILPSLVSAIGVAFLLNMMLSLDDVIVSFFVSGPNFSVLPIHVYSMARRGINPSVNALVTLMVGVTAVLVLGYVMMKRKEHT